MHFLENEIYHIYNRGNQKQNIFYTVENYLFFLQKVKKYLSPRCNILNWCLMPNHFHFLVQANLASVQALPNSRMGIQGLSEGLRLLLSSYTKSFNNMYNLTGNLFQQKTKAKCTSLVSDQFNTPYQKKDYSTTAFHYIHQNAWLAGIVNRIEDWEFSSFKDYCGFRNGTLCKKDIAYQELNIDKENLYFETYNTIDPADLRKIFS